jgi:transcriptional regulator with XRE-family HTH domain
MGFILQTVVSDYLTLCQLEAKRQSVSERQLGRRANLHHSSISNYLTGKREPKASDLQEIIEALNIDSTRAFIAIRIFRSPDAYDKPVTNLLALLIPFLAHTLSSEDCQLEDDLRDWEASSLCEKIRHLIIELLGPRSRFRHPFLGFRDGR